MSEVHQEAGELGDPPLFKVNTKRIDAFYQPRTQDEVALIAQQELVMNEDWVIDEDTLTDQEAERWFACKSEPSMERGLSLFSEAAALDECALELTVQATKLCGEAESIQKEGLEMMVAATQPAPSTSTSTASPEPEGSSSNPIAVESSPPSSSATPNIGPLVILAPSPWSPLLPPWLRSLHPLPFPQLGKFCVQTFCVQTFCVLT